VLLQNIPDDRTGLSVECPRCQNYFTLAAVPRSSPVQLRTRPLVKQSAPPIAPVSPTPPTEASLSAEKPLSLDTEYSLDHLLSDTSPDLPIVPTPPQLEEVETEPVPAPPSFSPLGLAAFLVASLALLSISFPTIRLVTIPLSVLSLVLGIWGLSAQATGLRRLALPLVGSLVGFSVLVLTLLCPGWLGFVTSEAEERAEQEALARTAAPLGGQGQLPRQTDASEWVDASQEAVLQGDVRVRVSSAVVQSVEVKDAKGTHPSKEKYLFIGVRISNAGVERPIEFAGWNGEGPDAAQWAPRLEDPNGKEVRRYDPGTHAEKTTGPHRRTLLPWKFADDVLVFEAPPPDCAYLHLELPSAAFGAPGQLRLAIPARMIVLR
jgi:hypothetical protein